eukprot:Skav228369  [mRNA]  locus=scaffold1981:218104:219510:+ [translate_table: standard]
MEEVHNGFVPQPRSKNGVPKRRIHELDWFRALMVILVVYAHISRSGMRGGVHGNVQVDDRIYDLTDPSPLGVRWISEVRQYCLPLLFFVSGAASACSWKQSPRGLVKIFLFTVFGVAFNALLWFLGPQNPDCDPGTGYGRPECKGLVFDFTICPNSGNIFPLVFQMWYTGMLMALMLLNWPLFAFLRNQTCHIAVLGIQFIASVGLQTTFVILSGHEIPNPALVLGLMASCEVIFLSLSVLTMMQHRPTRLPLRFIHYCLGVVATIQFGCIPIAPVIEHISGAFVLFILSGFNKSFQLGFVLTVARLPHQEEALPIVSMYWPMMVILRTMTAPSSNWYAAGNLTYPYYPRMLDRADYVAGAVIFMFVVDRAGRAIECKALPSWLANGTLLLYLLHPWMMALLILAVRGTRLEDTGSVWILCLVASGLLGLLTIRPWRSWRCCSRSKASFESGSSCESELSSEEGHASA